MKKSALFLFAILVSTAASFAQSKAETATVTTGQHVSTDAAREYADALQKELSLTAEQTERVYTLKLHSQKKIKRVESAFSNDPAAQKTQKADITADFDRTMKEILTPDQYAKWDKK